MWAIHVPRRVERELANAPAAVQSALRDTLATLQHDPHPPGCKKLKGRLSCWRVRVGSHRILYDILEREHAVVLLKIGPRKDVYR